MQMNHGNIFPTMFTFALKTSTKLKLLMWVDRDESDNYEMFNFMQENLFWS